MSSKGALQQASSSSSEQLTFSHVTGIISDVAFSFIVQLCRVSKQQTTKQQRKEEALC